MEQYKSSGYSRKGKVREKDQGKIDAGLSEFCSGIIFQGLILFDEGNVPQFCLHFHKYRHFKHDSGGQ